MASDAKLPAYRVSDASDVLSRRRIEYCMRVSVIFFLNPAGCGDEPSER